MYVVNFYQELHGLISLADVSLEDFPLKEICNEPSLYYDTSLYLPIFPSLEDLTDEELSGIAFTLRKFCGVGKPSFSFYYEEDRPSTDKDATGTGKERAAEDLEAPKEQHDKEVAARDEAATKAKDYQEAAHAAAVNASEEEESRVAK